MLRFVFLSLLLASLAAPLSAQAPVQAKAESPADADRDLPPVKSDAAKDKLMEERIKSGEIMPPEYAGEDIDPNDPRGVAGTLEGLVWPAIKTMIMLLVVLGLIYLSLHKGLGKLISKTQAGKRIQVVERVNLDQKRSIFIVRVDGEEMLLGASEGGLSPLRPQSAKSFEMAQKSKNVKVAETGVRQNGERIRLREDDDA